MAYQEISLLEFQDQFSSQEKCLEHLFMVRWADGFRCPSCNHDRLLQGQEQRLVRVSFLSPSSIGHSGDSFSSVEGFSEKVVLAYLPDGDFQDWSIYSKDG